MVYVSECPPDSSGVVLSALAESVVSPKIVPWEMTDASVRWDGMIGYEMGWNDNRVLKYIMGGGGGQKLVVGLSQLPGCAGLVAPAVCGCSCCVSGVV